MNTELFDQWAELSRGAMEPVMRFNQITARAMERVARQQLDLARDYLDFSARQLQVLGETKDPQKLFAEEGKIAVEFGQKLRGRTEEFLQITAETQQALAGWVDDTARSAAKTAGKVKPAA
jgi:phasin family protein